MAKLTVEQKLQRAHVWLMNNPKYCLYSGIFMLGKTEVRDDVGTACTNGRDVMYGREFMDDLSEPELRAVALHENLHKAFRHLTTWRSLYKENAQLANMACDYVINLMIKDSDPRGVDVKLPDCGLVDEQYRGLNAKQVFDKLKEQGESGGGDGFDEHDWKGAEELSEGDLKELQKQIDQALRQGAILADKMNGNVGREVKDLLEPKIDWREALRDFITSFCADKDVSTWRKPNRRWVDQDVYLPSLIGESVGPLVVAVDTSGSIGGDDLGAFLSEVVSICKTVTPERIDLLYWDHRVARHEKYEPDGFGALMQSTKPAGGGGTDVNCVFRYAKDKSIKPEAVIVLTDGYTPWPDAVDVPTLFAMSTDIVAPVGKTVRIN